MPIGSLLIVGTFATGHGEAGRRYHWGVWLALGLLVVSTWVLRALFDTTGFTWRCR